MSDEMFDLDTDLDSVADLVQFINPHDGTHVFGIVFAGMDKIGDKRGIKVVYQMVASLEQADADAPQAPVGSLFSESFTGNDMGKKLLKLRMKQLFGEEIEGAMRPYIEAMNDKFKSEFMVKMTTKVVHTKGKGENAGQTYENVRILDAEAIEPITLPEGFEWQDYTPSEEE